MVTCLVYFFYSSFACFDCMPWYNNSCTYLCNSLVYRCVDKPWHCQPICDQINGNNGYTFPWHSVVCFSMFAHSYPHFWTPYLLLNTSFLIFFFIFTLTISTNLQITFLRLIWSRTFFKTTSQLFLPGTFTRDNHIILSTFLCFELILWRKLNLWKTCIHIRNTFCFYSCQTLIT